MKAKEILHLCEDEQKLSSDEIADLINNYFIKKFKSIGMTVDSDGVRFNFAELVVGSESDEKKQKKRSSLFFKKLIQILKSHNVYSGSEYGSRLFIKLPNSSVKYNQKISVIFTLSLSYSSNDDVVIYVAKSYRLDALERHQWLADHEEFSTDSGLHNVYMTVDAIAKAIRLTSYV